MSDTSLPLQPHIHIAPSEDRSRARLTITFAGGESLPLELTLAEVSDLIAALGMVRHAMLGDVQPSIAGARFTPVRKTEWALQLDRETQGSILAFQHPAYGPLGLVLAPGDSVRLCEGLDMHRRLSAMIRPASERLN